MCLSELDILGMTDIAMRIRTKRQSVERDHEYGRGGGDGLRYELYCADQRSP